jgi:hypothetical protein
MSTIISGRPVGKAFLRRWTLPLMLGISFPGACATGARPQPQTAARLQDAAPEKIAAQRSAANLGLQADDDRWGVEAARERRRQSDERKAAAKQRPATPLPAVAAPGPVDLRTAP